MSPQTVVLTKYKNLAITITPVQVLHYLVGAVFLHGKVIRCLYMTPVCEKEFSLELIEISGVHSSGIAIHAVIQTGMVYSN